MAALKDKELANKLKLDLGDQKNDYCQLLTPPSGKSGESWPSTTSTDSSSRSYTSSKKAPLELSEDPGTGRIKKKPTKIIFINPPSSLHPDIQPPSLVRVQRALRAHTTDVSFISERIGAQLPHLSVHGSPFRDDKGRFILHGSSDGYYVGDVIGGLPHGRGQHFIPLSSNSLTSISSTSTETAMHLLYDGDWDRGAKTGSGALFYTDGEEYQGQLRNSQRWGRGWMRYKDGSLYIGDWLRGRRHGIGIQCFKNGNCYIGSFCKDSQDGWGTFYWTDIRRKFEGEWVSNKPYSGQYSQLNDEDLKCILKALLQNCPQSPFCQLFENLAPREKEMEYLHLGHPILTIFDVISTLRSVRAGPTDANNVYKTQVERKENLTASQLQLLKKLFEVMTPVMDKNPQLDIVHLRRMLVLARIDPDIGQGEKLIAHLNSCAHGRSTIGFDELLLYILQHHHP